MNADVKKYDNWTKDLKKTIPALNKIPEIFFKNKWCIESIEENENIILKKLDTKCGIDWILENNDNLITVASRIQIGDINWNSFTIRKIRCSGGKTEYEKRINAIKNNYLYPLYTCQCYFNDKYDFLGGAIMRTKDLYKSLENGYSENRSDNIFIIKYFKDIKNEGFSIRIKN